MPKYLRDEIRQDILAALAQSQGNELSKVPQKWKKQLDQGQNLIKLDRVVKAIKYDIEKLLENLPRNAQGG